MHKKCTILRSVFVLFIGLTILSGVMLAQTGRYAGGIGTPEAPYQISSVSEFIALADNSADWDKHFILTSDIKLSKMTPMRACFIGTWEVNFTGTFDGADHSISGLKLIIKPEGPEEIDAILHYRDSYIGLFGCIGQNGRVENLNLKNTRIIADEEGVGTLAGYNDGVIINCSATGSIAGEGSMVGGLVGSNDGSIMSCVSKVKVQGDDTLGGLVGGSGGYIENCIAKGNVTGREANGVGGLIGFLDDGEVINCQASGNTLGYDNVGGLIGDSFANNIINSHASGSVKGLDCIGGLIGYCNSNIMDSYAEGNVTLLTDEDGEGFGTAGGLIGWDDGDDCLIRNCYASGNVRGYDGSYGGLIGESGSYDRRLEDCYANGNVHATGDFYIGGLVGSGIAEMTINCFATGKVSGVAGIDCQATAGGLVGMSDGSVSGIVCQSYSTSPISIVSKETCNVGGLVGDGWGDGSFTSCFYNENIHVSCDNSYVGGLAGGATNISNCYFTGKVNVKGANNSIGGIAGDGEDITNCYNSGQIKANGEVNDIAGIVNGSYSGCFWNSTLNPKLLLTDTSGLTYNRMLLQEVYMYEGWDFTDVWAMKDGQNMPTLRCFVNEPDSSGSNEPLDAQPVELYIDSCNVTAGKKRGKDSIKIKGIFDLPYESFDNVNEIIVSITSPNDANTPIMVTNIPFDSSKIKKGIFNYKGTTQGKVALKQNMAKKTLSFSASNISLQGQSAPLQIEILFGDYIGVVDIDEEIINGTKGTMPTVFLNGFKDYLKVIEIKTTVDQEIPFKDKLYVKGTIAVVDEVADWSNDDLFIQWGNDQLTIPASDIHKRGSRYIFNYSQGPDGNTKRAEGVIDVPGNKFKIKVHNVNISEQIPINNFYFSTVDFDPFIE